MRPTIESLTPYRVLSLGAGVQSSTIALMMHAGEIEPCELAIFADTGAEPKRVYEWLAWLRTRLSFPVAIVQQGAGLTDRLERACRGECYVGNPPLYTLDGGLLKRGCTRDFKLAPIFRETQRSRQGRPVVMVLGISWDERQRMRAPSKRYIVRHEYPLIDCQLTRQDCLRWMATHDYPTPPRSACVYCPYRCDLEWRRLRDTDPDGWAEACRMDALMRLSLPGIRQRGEHAQQQCFVHRSCVPLADVDLSTDLERGQQLLPGAGWADCEGMCGV
jgi:hypothetical protein